MTLPSPLPIARYQFEFTVTKSFTTPDYCGSMLRGSFGHALKKIACVSNQQDCKQCELYHRCPYTAIFETPPKPHVLQKFSQIPSPYIIEPIYSNKKHYANSERFVFSMVLTGIALKEISLLILAWIRVFEKGVSKDKGQGVLKKVSLAHPDDQLELVFKPGDNEVIKHSNELHLPINKSLKTLCLKIKTPWRIQKNSKPITSDSLLAKDILISLARRTSLVNEFHNNIPNQYDFSLLYNLVDEVQVQSDLYWQDWSRYSTRQKHKMTLGGFMGDVKLSGNLTEFISLLYLGQWLHVGKNTTFGLGQYQLYLTPTL